MADESTIGLRFQPTGEENLEAAINRVIASMKTLDAIQKQVSDTTLKLAQSQKISIEEADKLTRSTKQVQAALSAMDKEQQRTIAEMSRFDAATLKAAKAVDKLRVAEAELSSTALGRFNIGLAGSAEKLKQLETGAYNASRQSILMSQQMVTHPIATLNAFRASTEKAAVAADYFRQQLSFIAASRFGTIMIFGTILAGIATAFKKVVDASIEMNTAIRRVSSAFVDTGNAALYYDKIQRSLAIGATAYGTSVKDVATILWELKSAGLSASETFVAQDTVQKLVIAGGEDIAQTTRLLVGLYKTFGNEIKGATTEQEKFAEIGGTVAFANIKAQGTIDTLLQSYKYAAPIAKEAGMSFNEMTAAIIVTSNRMQQGSTAGTGLSQVILSLIKNWRTFAKEYNIALDPQKPLQFSEFLRKMAGNQDLINKKLGAMKTLSDEVNVRGMRNLLALLSGYKEYDETLTKINEGSMAEFLKLIADERMNTFAAQWERLKKGVSTTLVFEDATNAIKDLLKGISDLLEAAKRLKGVQDESPDTKKIKEYAGWIKYLIPYYAHIKLSIDQINLGGQRFLEWGKKIEKEKLFEAVELGVEGAKEKWEELYGVQTKTFYELLSDAQQYEYELLTQGKTLEQQIAYRTRLLELEEEMVINAKLMGLKQEEITKHSEAALRYRRELSDLTKKQADDIERIAEKEAKNQSQNLATLEEIAKKMATIKSLTPVQEMEANNVALQLAVQRLIPLKTGTEEWRKGMRELADATVKVNNNLQMAEKAVDKTLSNFSKLQSAAQSYTKALIEQGRPEDAERILNDQLAMAEARKNLAMTAEQQAFAEKLVSQALKEQMDSGLFSAEGQNLSRRYLESQREIYEKEKEIDDILTQQAEDAKYFVSTSQDTLNISLDIVEAISSWDQGIESVSDGIEGGINAALIRTKELVKEIKDEMRDMTARKKEGEDFLSLDEFNRLQRQLLDESLRGPIG